MSNRILPPGSLFDALKPVDDLSNDLFEEIRDSVSEDCSFHLNDDQVLDLEKKTDMDKQAVSILIGALGYLYFRCEETEDTFDNRENQVESLFTELGSKNTDSLENPERFKKRLTLLLAKNPVHRRYTQAARLQNGFIPTVKKISTFLDVRPSFDDDITEIDGYVQVIQLGIHTDSKNPFEREFTVQMNKAGVRDLKETIDRLDKKMKILENAKPFSTDIMDINK